MKKKAVCMVLLLLLTARLLLAENKSALVIGNGEKRIITNPNNVSFKDFVRLLEAFGFYLERTKGSHHIFHKAGIREIINIQDVEGEVKSYQIRQFLKIVEKYNLLLGDK
ncbi:MAG: type II toxin-antitoxin system HicA family toxin [Spirochaetota bacterium]